MKAFIVYCHPSEDSFTSHVRDSFIRGIVDSGNEYILSDLYKMNFKTDMSEKEYLRDSNYRDTPDLEEDVLAEQKKIMRAMQLFLYILCSGQKPQQSLLVGLIESGLMVLHMAAKL